MFVASVLISVRDAKGKISTTEVKFSVGNTFSVRGLEVIAQRIAELVAPLLAGQIVRIGVALSFELPASLGVSGDNTLSPDSDVEEGARFQFRTAGGYTTSLRLPTFYESKLISGTDQVNLTDADVAAFVNAMVDQISVTDGPDTYIVNPSDYRGDGIVHLVFAREQFISTRRRR